MVVEGILAADHLLTRILPEYSSQNSRRVAILVGAPRIPTKSPQSRGFRQGAVDGNVPRMTFSPMKSRFTAARTPRLVSALTFLAVFALSITSAFAGGSISYSKKVVQESGGGWHLMMTVSYGGKPNTAHVPMRFTFTPTAITERFLDDAHGDKPQSRKIPLVGQTALNESVDVDFSDPSGRIYDKTRFDFTITRSHNFVAGDYSVTVHRADGGALGGAQTLTLEGENPVIDRRSIQFVGTSKQGQGTGRRCRRARGHGQENDTPPTAAAAEAPAAPAEGARAPRRKILGRIPQRPLKYRRDRTVADATRCPPAEGIETGLFALACAAALAWRLRQRRLPL